ncbi:unnamed protein product [Brassica rapa subsp. trilocularis]
MDSYFVSLAAAAISFYALFGTIFFNRKSRSSQEDKTEASSSSLTLLAPPSSFPHNWKHHVFPSFHGADVRTNFLGHVVKELRSKGIDLFIDNDIERSKSIGPELVDAIKGSRIAMVLLSENYASSTWCLNELVEIMKCRQEFGQTVMSIFYQVDPSDVKKQTGQFGKVFRKTCKGKTEDEIRRWKRALTEVAQIAGFHSSNGKSEAEMIEDIATDVSNKLSLSAPCSDFDGLVGMESKMTEMRSLLQLDSDEVRKIGILGPSGIGKTTIARSIFNRHSQDFQLSVFIDNIKRNYAIPACSDDYSVKLNLQKHFMSQLTNETCTSISHLGVVKDRLKDKKVLVVLDDVDRLVQLEAMAKESSWFGPGSRIIITTQDQKVLKASGINHIHKVCLPSHDEALQMFCMYAFDQKEPKDGFQELAWKVSDLVGSLPLGLKVMGSYFRGMSEQEWIKALPKLKTHLDRDREISSILKFSYDALHDEDKSLFLHIACFFDDEPVDIVEGCLAKCFLDVTQGIRVLVEKSLISIEDEMIKMSKLLVQLGRQIVQNESVSEPGKRQFLNDASDIGEVLSDDRAGNSSVIGINLERDDEITWTSERAFERLSHLQFLRILGKCVEPQSMNYLSQKLRVLIWRNFKITCFPSSFNPKFLVKLEMHSSNLVKFWEGIKPLNNLKWMDLSDSEKLEELPDFSTATNLHDLNLSNCERLVELLSSIGSAVNLHQLNFQYCSSLVELPSSIGNAVNRRELTLGYCSSLVKLPSSIWNIVNLKVLTLAYCSSLVELPSSDLYSLKSYHESSTDIQELDPWIGRISRLRRHVLMEMEKLVSLPQLPDSLLHLFAEECESLERLDCAFSNPDISLYFINCYKLNQEARDLIIRSGTLGVFPAKEVPQCFTYRSSGSSVTVKLNQMPVGKSTKFNVAVICDIDPFEFGETKQEDITCRVTSGGNAITFNFCPGRRIYPGHLYKYEIEVETEDVASTELVFEFEINYAIAEDEVTWKIRGCGILQLLDGPLLSLRDGDGDF